MIDDDLEQSHVINELHNVPRFGHGNEIVALVSQDRSEQEDYIRGMLSFCCFLLMAFYIWWFVLVILKVVFPELVGCAAGGHTLDVAKLRKAKIRRDIRRRWIVRAWRVQWAFLFASILIPIATLLLTRNGLSPFIHSLDDIKGVADEVEAVSIKGIAIAEALQSARNDLARVNTTIGQQQVGLQSTGCPKPLHYNASMLALPPTSIVAKYIEAGVDEVKAFIDYYAFDAHIGLNRAVDVSYQVTSSIEWIYDNDWAIKFFLLTINVVNAFFLLGVFLSQQDIVSYKYQQFLSLQIIPIFTLLLVCSSIMTCAFGMTAMLNADFCHGINNVNGTMTELFAQSGISESDLSYRAFLHYMEGCLGESPMDFIHEVNSVISYTIDAANLLGEEPTVVHLDNGQCTNESSILTAQIHNVTSALVEIQRQVRDVLDLTGCHQINPVIRRIIHGSTCSDTVGALAWLFGGFCFITLLGFVMLSVRAALFNSVIRAPRRKRQKEREKEFDEYKAYMAEFYKDVDHWELDLTRKKKSDPKRQIVATPTFDTEEASESRHDHDDDDVGSEAACFESPKGVSEDSSSAASSDSSSYESDYSEDSEEQKSIMSLSVLGKLFHINRGDDDNQSFMAGMSMLGFDTPSNASHVDSRSVLELQTPRRRRPTSLLGLYRRSPNSEASSSMASPSLHLRPPPSLGLYCRSPNSSSSTMASPSSRLQHPSSLGLYCRSPDSEASSPMAGSNLTPTAPSKPSRFLHRTRASRKDA